MFRQFPSCPLKYNRRRRRMLTLSPNGRGAVIFFLDNPKNDNLASRLVDREENADIDLPEHATLVAYLVEILDRLNIDNLAA